METLTAQPLSHHPQTAIAASPENVTAGPKLHWNYRCLINQLAQKWRIPLPIFQTQNEGSQHQPRFRATVFVDGVSYTSLNTFQHLKLAEMDVSRVAYLAITQKSKSDALLFVQEDKVSCKSIMVEYAAKTKKGMPVYETSRPESFPIFHSQLHFDGVTLVGEYAKSKKEAEQLAARALILKYLVADSKAGSDMLEVVTCKLRHFLEEKKRVQDELSARGAHTGAGHDLALTGLGPSTKVKSPTTPESSLAQDTMVPSSGVAQQSIPQLAVESITQAAPVIVQPPAQISTLPVNPTIPVGNQLQPQVTTQPINPFIPVMQPPTQPVKVEPVNPVIPAVTRPVKPVNISVRNQLPPQVTTQNINQPVKVEPVTVEPVKVPPQPPTQPVTVEPVNPIIPAVTLPVTMEPINPIIPIVTQPFNQPVKVEPVNPIITQPLNQPMKVEPINPIIPLTEPRVDPIVPVITQPPTPQATNLSSSAMQQSNPKASPAPPLVGDQPSNKKRNRNNRKNGHKKMRDCAKMPLVPSASQVLPFSSQ